MTHLASFPAASFSIQVDGSSQLDSPRDDSVGLQEVGSSVGGETEEVEHGGRLRDEVERREREGQDSVEVSGVQREVASFDSVMPRVVWSWGDLVQEEGTCSQGMGQSARTAHLGVGDIGRL